LPEKTPTHETLRIAKPKFRPPLLQQDRQREKSIVSVAGSPTSSNGSQSTGKLGG
jgi:hypothetical protein